MDAKAFGQLFRQRREEQGISKRDVEQATSIREQHITAVEEGEFDQLFSAVHAKGFVSQYANFLGLDGDSLIRENPSLFPKAKQQDFTYGIGTLEARGHPGGGVAWLPNAVLFAVSFFILFAAWLVAHYFDLL